MNVYTVYLIGICIVAIIVVCEVTIVLIVY